MTRGFSLTLTLEEVAWLVDEVHRPKGFGGKCELSMIDVAIVNDPCKPEPETEIRFTFVETEKA